ncbi:MAG TPA: hypothetical protein PLX55_00625 [bacterium]|nr:hypothetical protein [bacterium]
MTYEEKLDLLINELAEAKKRTRIGQPAKIFVTKQSELVKKIIPQEIHELLLQLQDDEKILTIKEIPTDLKTGWEVNLEKIDYFLVYILDVFDDWYESYLMKQKTGLESIDYINMLRIYDVVLDINEQIQLTNKTTVSIHLLPSLVRFSALFPADTIGMRDKYCETRWDSLKYLKEKGFIDDFKHNSAFHRWDTVVTVSLKLSKFDEFYRKIKDEYVKRNKTDRKEEKPKTNNLMIDTKKVAIKVTYDPQKGELDIEGKKVRLNKDSFRAKLLELLLKDDKSRKKEWSWDEVIEAIEDTKDEELTKENKNKFYPACDGLSKHIASKTGVNDLLIFNKSTVQINPKYL